MHENEMSPQNGHGSPLSRTDLSKTKDQITIIDFLKVDMRVGRVVKASLNEKARKPAYQMTIDFGPLGEKTTSAQIVKNYTPESLVGKLVIAVVNFPPKNVAGVKSEVLVLGVDHPEQGVVLLQPTMETEVGTPIA